ncbi:poly-gamma-glutamate hydrolase family protein [Halostagnicola bangensis]
MTREERSRETYSKDRSHSRRRVVAASAGIAGAGVLAAGYHTQIARSQDLPPSGTGQDVYADGCDDIDHWELELEEAAESWSARSSPSRYCSVPCTLTNNDELAVGQQVRVGTGNDADEFENAVYTVASEHQDETLRLTPSGLDRIGTSESETVTVGSQAVHPSYDTRQGGELNDEYIEYVLEEDDENGESDDDENGEDESGDVVVIAPHGGYIEYGTDFQADRVVEELGATGWICSGFNEGGGAFDRWHSYSTEIHPRSFPELDSLLDRSFEWGVAFHGYSNDGILVGGTADDDAKEVVTDAISEQLPDRTVSVVERDATEYTGANPENVLNQLAPVGRTIQLEQPADVRGQEWAGIADGVSEAFEELLE